jgi:hypothetical protein
MRARQDCHADALSGFNDLRQLLPSSIVDFESCRTQQLSTTPAVSTSQVSRRTALMRRFHGGK